MFRHKKTIPIYSDKITKKYLIKTFKYCFENNSKEYTAILKSNLIQKELFIIDKGNKVKIRPIIVEHGKINSICYIIDKKLAYISDVSEIFEKDYHLPKFY